MRLPYNLRSGHAQRETRCHFISVKRSRSPGMSIPACREDGARQEVRSQSRVNGMNETEGSEPDWQLAAMVAATERGKRRSFNKKEEVRMKK